MIEAKSVVNNRFWILRNDHAKIGHVLKKDDFYSVSINGNEMIYDSFDKLQSDTQFKFINLKETTKGPQTHVYGYECDNIAHNAMWYVDGKKKIPLFTTNEDTVSLKAAGYYNVKINGKWEVQFCPKLIVLQRNEYEGPTNTPNLNMFGELF